MAIDFPSNPSNGQQISAGGNAWQYSSAKSVWEKILTSGKIGGVITTYTNTSDLPLSNVAAGTQAFVTSSNALYISNGSGWYSIALVNTNPNITSVQDASSNTTPFTLATDGSATVITITASDPEGFSLTYGYSVTSGSLTNGGGTTATVTQANNVFTITPTTNASYAGTFSLTFTVSDGINTSTSVNSFTLQFTISNSSYTTLLVTAVDTSDNNNITDSSTSNHNITPYGDAHAGTFSPYRHGGYSVYFDGTGDSLTTTSTDYNLGTSSAFTVEFWYYFDESRTHTVFDFYNSSAVQSAKLAFTSTNVYLYDGTANILALTRTQNVGVWEHFCWTRDASNNHTFYINGSQVGTSTATTSIDAYTIDLGRRAGSFNSTFMKGYISDFRLVKGTAITPSSGGPTERLTAVTNTSLLTCHLPYISDGSSSAHSITINGNTSTKPIGPYDYQQYSSANHGGSINFDGSDYCTIADSEDFEFGSGDFTVECWVYMTAYEGTGFNMFLHKGGNNSNAWHFDYKNGTTELRFLPYVGNVNASVTATTTLDLNQWYHIAAVRNGNTIVLYKNGKAVSSTAYSLTIDNTADAIHIGQRAHLNDRRLTGYLSDIRINKSAVYTSDFTVPTSPVSSTGSTLHVKGTDASIIDKSQTSNLKLVGNTTGSTTQVKFADTKSIYFDGAGDHIEIDGPFNLGTQPWTWETWIYTADSTYTLINIGESITTGTSIEKAGTSFYIYDLAANTYYSFSGVPADNTWTHLAFCRQSNGNHDFYKDGTRISNYTSWNSKDWGSLAKLKIGEYWTTNQSDFNGYFQDMRLTLGKSRYTAADESSNIPSAPLEG